MDNFGVMFVVMGCLSLFFLYGKLIVLIIVI